MANGNFPVADNGDNNDRVMSIQSGSPKDQEVQVVDNNTNQNNYSYHNNQFLYTIFWGIFFGAILLRTNKLTPLAIMHGLIDFVFGFSKIMGTETQDTTIETTDLSAEIINAIASSIVVLPLFIIGIIVLKKVQKENILHKISLSKKKGE